MKSVGHKISNFYSSYCTQQLIINMFILKMLSDRAAGWLKIFIAINLTIKNKS